MTMTAAVGITLAQVCAMLLVMADAWAVQRRTGNSDPIDVTWTFGVGTHPNCRDWCDIVTSFGRRAGVDLVTASRFAIARRTNASGDDPRYTALARACGEVAPLRIFEFVQIQALASMSLLATNLTRCKGVVSAILCRTCRARHVSQPLSPEKRLRTLSLG